MDALSRERTPLQTGQNFLATSTMDTHVMLPLIKGYLSRRTELFSRRGVLNIRGGLLYFQHKYFKTTFHLKPHFSGWTAGPKIQEQLYNILKEPIVCGTSLRVSLTAVDLTCHSRGQLVISQNIPAQRRAPMFLWPYLTGMIGHQGGHHIRSLIDVHPFCKYIKDKWTSLGKLTVRGCRWAPGQPIRFMLPWLPSFWLLLDAGYRTVLDIRYTCTHLLYSKPPPLQHIGTPTQSVLLFFLYTACTVKFCIIKTTLWTNKMWSLYTGGLYMQAQ